MMLDISQLLGWSKKEADRFFSHPERKPLQSGFSFSENEVEAFEQVSAIGTYLRLKYEQSREADSKAEAGELLRQFYTNAVNYFLAPRCFLREDKWLGIDSQERLKGEIEGPNEEVLGEFWKAAVTVAESRKLKEPLELMEQMLAVTEGGNIATIFTYLTGKGGQPELREALGLVYENRLRNKELGIEKLQQVWVGEAIRLSMGINLDFWLELNGFPKAEIVEEKLHEFLNREDLVREVWQHLEVEAGDVIAEAKALGSKINFWDILTARAEHYGFDNKVESVEERKAKDGRAKKIIGELFPLTREELDTRLVVSTTRFGATARPFTSTYPNEKDQPVEVIVLNPRESEKELVGYAGHEIGGHSLHHQMLRRAAEAGIVPENTWDKLPGSVKEELAILVEDQVIKLFQRDQSKGAVESGELATKKGKEWSDFWNAFINRRQASYGLTQLKVRKLMEKRWLAGERDLKKVEAERMIDELEPKVTEWYAEGVPIEVPHAVLNNINPLALLDGLVYLKEYVVGESVREAFKQRFGEIWVDKPEARAVLLALMVETGKQSDKAITGGFVSDADIEEIKEMLVEWGIKEEEI